MYIKQIYIFVVLAKNLFLPYILSHTIWAKKNYIVLTLLREFYLLIT